MKQQRILELLKEKRTTYRQRLEDQGFEFNGNTPIEHYEIYVQGNIEVIYDPVKNVIVCGRVTRKDESDLVVESYEKEK